VAAYQSSTPSARQIEPFIGKHSIDMTEFKPVVYRSTRTVLSGRNGSKERALIPYNAHLSFSFVRRTQAARPARHRSSRRQAKAATQHGDDLAKGLVNSARALDGQGRRSNWHVHVTDEDGHTLGRFDIPDK
jgi:hypothetical protein